MTVKTRKIEVDAETAELLEARAAGLGISVSALLAEIAGAENVLPPDLARLRAKGEGPWSLENLEEDARRLAEFDRSHRRALERGQGVDTELGQTGRASFA